MIKEKFNPRENNFEGSIEKHQLLKNHQIGPDKSMPVLIDEFETAVGEELISCVAKLIDKLIEIDENLEDDNTWDLIKKLTGILIESWAIDELQESLEKLMKKNEAKTEEQLREFLVIKMFYEILERIEKQNEERKKMIISKIFIQFLEDIIELLYKPVKLVIELITGKTDKEKKPTDREFKDMIKEISINPEESWDKIRKMPIDEAIAFFRLSDERFNKEGEEEKLMEKPEITNKIEIDLIAEGLKKMHKNAPKEVLVKSDKKELADTLRKIWA